MGMPSINSSASQALNSYALCLNIHMCSYHGLASQNSEQDHICTISKDIKSFYFYTYIWIGFPPRQKVHFMLRLYAVWLKRIENDLY
jgi:hypothetical protein